MDEQPKNVVGVILVLTISFLAMSALMFFVLTSCTISFQNISTHGTATDLVDENQAASPKVDAQVSIPIKPM